MVTLMYFLKTSGERERMINLKAVKIKNYKNRNCSSSNNNDDNNSNNNNNTKRHLLLPAQEIQINNKNNL